MNAFFASPWQKLGVFGFTFLVAILIALEGRLERLLFFFLFPAGLEILIGKPKSDVILALLGWLFYTGLGLAIIGLKHKLLVVAFYALFILVLVVNVQGCQALAHNSHFP